MTIKVKFMITAIVLMLAVSIVPAASFAAKDDLTGRTLETEMRAMVEMKILYGYDDGTYRPGDLVTRGQFAAFIARALDLPAGTHTFKDVPPSSSLYKEISAVYKAGIMSGYDSSTFNQTQLITREQAARTMKNVLVYLGLDLHEKQVDFVDMASFSSPVGISAARNILHYGITAGIPVSGGLKFDPAAHTTREQAAAFIYRLLQVEAPEEAPVEPATPPPTSPTPPPATSPTAPPATNDGGYTLGYVEDGQLVQQTYKHSTYTAAADSFEFSSAKALYKGNEIIQIKSGMVFGDVLVLKDGKWTADVTPVYKEPIFIKANQVTYVEYGREMRYIESNEDFVKVQVGGTIGYVKQGEVDMVPMELAGNRDYYTVNQWGSLYHHLYNYRTKTKGSYLAGPAPAGLAEGVHYYSADGVHFYDKAGSLKAKGYQYFQYQSVRTKTSYTAEELEAFIMERLTEISKTDKYKDALTKSKLIGMGEHFKALEAKYNVNALFMLAAAIHEGEYGMSKNSQEKNNMFGIAVFDSSTKSGLTYAKPENSIEAFARDYMNANYANPLGDYRSNGAAPGNKSVGVNVNYASDPTWGGKVAGHMYRIDLALGKKDYGRYQLAVTNYSSTINVRKEPVVQSGNILFTYKARNLGVGNAFGYPLAVVGSQKGADGYTWYQVFSDLNEGGYGWIREDLITLVK